MFFCPFLTQIAQITQIFIFYVYFQFISSVAPSPIQIASVKKGRFA